MVKQSNRKGKKPITKRAFYDEDPVMVKDNGKNLQELFEIKML